MIKKGIAYTLMLIGFAWIICICLDIFSAQHLSLWLIHSQHLTSGTMIPRDDAVSQMRELELAIQDVYQPLVIPALFMLAGAILNGIGNPKEIIEQYTERYPKKRVP